MFREYGLDGPGVRGFGVPTFRGGAGLANLGGAPMALLENWEGVMLPLRPGVGGARLEALRSGDSGRDSEGRRARAPGPSDWENLDLGTKGVFGLKFGFSVVDRLKLLLAYEGVVGEGGKSSEVPDERLRARCAGRKMPEPGVVVVKYWVPSTAPSFLPRDAKARLSSTPAKTPFLPRMLPTNLTTPCMPPGTSTRSPTSMSCASAMLLGEGDAPPVSALSEAWRAMVLALKERLGDDSAGRRFGRRRRGVLMELP